MTKVFIAQDGDELVLTAEGHATGRSDVCAGVSAIVYALAGYALNESAKPPMLRLVSGDAYIRCKASANLRAAFEMASIGFKQIAEGGAVMKIEGNI